MRILRSRRLLCTVACLLVLLGCSSPPLLFEEGSGDWQAYGDADWTVDGAAFTGRVTDGVGFVMTERPYTDFELVLEFWPDSTVNSGVFIRCKEQELSFTDCYELNIWDQHPQQENRTGAVVSRATPLTQVKTIGRWNTYRIKAEGNRIRAWINGKPTADLVDKDLAGGYIALQASGTGEVRFRGVRLGR